jgi:poly-gamma-glutamate synthesis protein (capsule biosynthesis protein)
LAHRAIDAGAKIVVGSHPHIIQDTEIYKNGFIAYSLGNLIFDQNFSPETMRGMLLKVQLFRDGNLIVTKNIVKLNSLFQPDKIISGKLEKIKFKDIKIR